MTVIFVMSVRPHGTTRLPLVGCWWNFIFKSFRKYVHKIQVLLESDKNNGHFTWRRHIYDYIWLNSSQNKKWFRQKLQWKSTHIFCSITFFRKSCLLRENVKKCGGARGHKGQYSACALHAAWLRSRTSPPARETTHKSTPAHIRIHTRVRTHTEK